MFRNFKLIFCSLCGIAVFAGFMMLVGSPHYIETIIALCLGVCTFAGLYFGKAIKKIIKDL